MPRSAALLALLVLAATPRHARSQTVTDQRVWVGVSAQQRIGGTSWRWFADGFARSRDGLDALDTTAVRAGLSRDLTTRSSVGGGVTEAQSRPAAGGVILEHRVFGQFLWRAAVAGGAVVLRTRFERRAIENNDDAAWRLREHVRFSRPVGVGRRVSVVAWDEIFVHTNTTRRYARGLDQNRAFVGVGVPVAQATVEVGYLNHFSDSRVGPNRVNHVLQTTIGLSF